MAVSEGFDPLEHILAIKFIQKAEDLIPMSSFLASN